LVPRGHREHHHVVRLDLAERGPREDRPGVRSRCHDRVDPRPLGAGAPHRRLGLGGDRALGRARADRRERRIHAGRSEPVCVADQGDLRGGLAGAQAAHRLLDIDDRGAGQRRLQGSRRGRVHEAQARDPEPANRAPRADDLREGLDAAERIVLVRVRELAEDAHVRDAAHAERVLVALGSARHQRIAGQRHEDGHRLEVDGDVRQPANVRRAEHGAVVAVGDDQVEPVCLHQRLDAPPSVRVLLRRDGRSGDVHADLPWRALRRRRS
jgi:hypothetical protein